MKNKLLHKWLVIMLVLVVPFLQNSFMCSASLPFGPPLPEDFPKSLSVGAPLPKGCPNKKFLGAGDKVVTGVYIDENGENRAIVENIIIDGLDGQIPLSLYGEFPEIGGMWITGIKQGALDNVIKYNKEHPETPIKVLCSEFFYAGRELDEEELECLKFH